MKLLEIYPMNFLASKLYTWYLKQAVNTTYNALMIPKIMIDTYSSTFKSVYRG